MNFKIKAFLALSISDDTRFFVFLLLTLVDGLFYCIQESAIFWLYFYYDNLITRALIWNARRKLKKIGKLSWAESITSSIDKPWENKKNG